MAVGPFLSHDSGYAELLGSDDWVNDNHYAVLATTTETINRATHVDLADIVNILSVAGDYNHQNLTGEAVDVNSTNIRFDCAKITFCSTGSITARYLFILKGTVAGAASTDKIIGHIDLDGTGNVSSVNAEFSFDPSANGLFEIARSAAV
jgi:hypothetical protein